MTILDDIFFLSQIIFVGSFSVLKYLINLGAATRAGIRNNRDNEETSPTHPVQYLINCFLCAWFITGKLFQKMVTTKIRFNEVYSCVDYRLRMGISNLPTQNGPNFSRRSSL